MDPPDRSLEAVNRFYLEDTDGDTEAFALNIIYLSTEQGERRMKRVFIGMACILFMCMPPVLAKEGFTIDEVTVHAFILPNGDLAIEEYFTYTFYKKDGEGPFNGTTRWINERGSDGVDSFTAFLSGNDAPLTVEKEDGVFKIHSQSMDETKTFHYQYIVKNAVNKYRDAGEFYWKFFDDSNESEIHNLTMYIHLPEEVDQGELDFYKHDITDSDIVQESGDTIVYRIETLPAYEMAEARIFFPQELLADKGFDKDQDILPAARKTEERLKQRMERSDERSAQVNHFTRNLILFYVIATVYLFFFRKEKRIRRALKGQHPEWNGPMIQLAAVHRNGKIRFDDVTTALLDLANKDALHLTEDSEHGYQHYVLTIKQHEMAHLKEYERFLIEWMFKEAGNGETLTFEQINKYIISRPRHFKERFREWKEHVQRDLELEHLYRPRLWFLFLRAWLVVQGPLLMGVYLYVTVRTLWPLVASIALTAITTSFIPKAFSGKVQNFVWWATYLPLVTLVGIETGTDYIGPMFLLFLSSTYLYFHLPKMNFTPEGLQQKVQAHRLKQWLKAKSGTTATIDTPQLDRRLFVNACALDMSRHFAKRHTSYLPLLRHIKYSTSPLSSSSSGSGSFGGGGGGGGGGGAGTF